MRLYPPFLFPPVASRKKPVFPLTSGTAAQRCRLAFYLLPFSKVKRSTARARIPRARIRASGNKAPYPALAFGSRFCHTFRASSPPPLRQARKDGKGSTKIRGTSMAKIQPMCCPHCGGREFLSLDKTRCRCLSCNSEFLVEGAQADAPSPEARKTGSHLPGLFVILLLWRGP